MRSGDAALQPFETAARTSRIENLTRVKYFSVTGKRSISGVPLFGRRITREKNSHKQRTFSTRKDIVQYTWQLIVSTLVCQTETARGIQRKKGRSVDSRDPSLQVHALDTDDERVPRVDPAGEAIQAIQVRVTGFLIPHYCSAKVVRRTLGGEGRRIGSLFVLRLETLVKFNVGGRWRRQNVSRASQPRRGSI